MPPIAASTAASWSRIFFSRLPPVLYLRPYPSFLFLSVLLFFPDFFPFNLPPFLFLTTFAVEAACSTVGHVIRQKFVWLETHPSVVRYEAGYAHRPLCFNFGKGGMRITQMQEFFQVSHVFADVDEAVLRMVLQFFLHLRAVGAGGHYVNFGHDV